LSKYDVFYSSEAELRSSAVAGISGGNVLKKIRKNIMNSVS